MSKSTPKSTPSCKGKEKQKITPLRKGKHLTTNHTILGKQIKKAHQIIKNVKAKHINTFTNICHLYQIRCQVLMYNKVKRSHINIVTKNHTKKYHHIKAKHIIIFGIICNYTNNHRKTNKKGTPNN